MSHDTPVPFSSLSISYISCTPYILERLSSWSTSRIRLSWPRPQIRLNLMPTLSHMYLSCCLDPPSILLFVPPFQVNNMAMLHLIYSSHTYLHYIHTTIYSLLHTSSTLLVRPAGRDPSWQEQVEFIVSVFVIRFHEYYVGAGIFREYDR
jgi:hypothetical protein